MPRFVGLFLAHWFYSSTVVCASPAFLWASFLIFFAFFSGQQWLVLVCLVFPAQYLHLTHNPVWFPTGLSAESVPLFCLRFMHWYWIEPVSFFINVIIIICFWKWTSGQLPLCLFSHHQMCHPHRGCHLECMVGPLGLGLTCARMHTFCTFIFSHSVKEIVPCSCYALVTFNLETSTSSLFCVLEELILHLLLSINHVILHFYTDFHLCTV